MYIISHIYCLSISLCRYCLNWGSKHSLVFYTLIELLAKKVVRFLNFGLCILVYHGLVKIKFD